MAQVNSVYKCGLCGNMVEFVHDGGTVPVCCGVEMNQVVENTQEAAVEKHIPVVEKIQGGFKISVGEVEHPMADEHYIEWIEVLVGSLVYRKQLKPGEAPVAEFMIAAETVTARAYCNLHGLWKA